MLSSAQIDRLLVSVKRPGNAGLLTQIPALAEERIADTPFAAGSSRLLYHYVRLDVIDLLIGSEWEEVDYTEGDEKESRSQRSKKLAEMRETTLGDIERLENEIVRGMPGGGAAVVCGQMTTQATVETTTAVPNPNDRRAAGDPLRRRLF